MPNRGAAVSIFLGSFALSVVRFVPFALLTLAVHAPGPGGPALLGAEHLVPAGWHEAAPALPAGAGRRLETLRPRDMVLAAIFGQAAPGAELQMLRRHAAVLPARTPDRHPLRDGAVVPFPDQAAHVEHAAGDVDVGVADQPVSRLGCTPGPDEAVPHRDGPALDGAREGILQALINCQAPFAVDLRMATTAVSPTSSLNSCENR